MDPDARKSLITTIAVTLRTLPRYLRHDLWRTCQPQHDQAVKAVAEMLVAKVGEGFDVEAGAPEPPDHAAPLYGVPEPERQR